MNQLSEIPVVVENSKKSGNLSIQVMALLEELKTLLHQLIKLNIPGYIDIRSIPLLPSEAEHLKDVLGKGEVKSTVDAMGITEIIETAIPGVWWIVNYNTSEEIISEFIEVAVIPEILKTQQLDLHDAPATLQARINRRENI